MLGRVSDYQSMLNRISFGTFMQALVASYVVGTFTGWMNVGPAWIRQGVDILGSRFSLGPVIVAGLFMVLARAFKLHDRISDALLLRESFDIDHILRPLALGAVGTAPSLATLKASRHDLMYKVFYAYASGMEDKPAVGRHLVTMALEQWSWVWVCVEGAAVATLAAFACLLGGASEAMFGCGIAAGVLGYCANSAMQQSIRYASLQVEAILMDGWRRDAIAECFRAL